MEGTETSKETGIETSKPKRKPLVPTLRRTPLPEVERDIKECVAFFNGGEPADPETGMNVIRRVLMQARRDRVRNARKGKKA